MKRDRRAGETPEQRARRHQLQRAHANYVMSDVDGLIAGSRLGPIYRHRRLTTIEGRLHREDDGRWMRMHFDPSEATVELLLRDAVITHLTWEQEGDEHYVVQLMAGDQVALRVSTAEWRFAPVDPEEGGMWLLTPQERAAVAHAVEVVVARDAAKLAMIDPRWVDNPESFWEGADNYIWEDTDGPVAVDLFLPAPPVEDWPAYVYRFADLNTLVSMPLYPADDDPEIKEELDLSLWLTTGPDGVVQVVVEDLCTS